MRASKQLFLSYSWDDSTVADLLQDGLSGYDVEVTRDARDLNFLDRLENFMDGMGSQYSRAV